MFTGVPNDLADAIGYELYVIDYLRATLHGQRETSIGGASIVLGDVTAEGVQRIVCGLSASNSFSEDAVRTALDHMRPLAFSAAFKIQDMIVEWVLRANGVNAWQFKEKLANYDKLLAAASLSEPALLAARPTLSRAYWELYRYLVPFRGTVIHKGGVVLEANGTVSIVKDGMNVRLTPAEQGSYMRAMCLVAKILSHQTKHNQFLEDLIEADLFELNKYHAQSGLVVRRARLEALTVHVSESHLDAREPMSVTVDFDQLRRVMEKPYPVGVDGRLHFAVTINAHSSTRNAVWQLPFEAVPSGVLTLTEGDERFDQYLTIT
jgi:hypothetical protein